MSFNAEIRRSGSSGSFVTPEELNKFDDEVRRMFPNVHDVKERYYRYFQRLEKSKKESEEENATLVRELIQKSENLERQLEEMKGGKEELRKEMKKMISERENEVDKLKKQYDNQGLGHGLHLSSLSQKDQEIRKLRMKFDEEVAMVKSSSEEREKKLMKLVRDLRNGIDEKEAEIRRIGEELKKAMIDSKNIRMVNQTVLQAIEERSSESKALEGKCEEMKEIVVLTNKKIKHLKDLNESYVVVMEEKKRTIQKLTDEKKEVEDRNRFLEGKLQEIEANMVKILTPTNESECYDYVFNVQRLDDGVGPRGWNVFNYQKIPGKMTQSLRRTPVITMTMVGLFGVGKSYIHSKIAGLSLPSGPSTHTRGLSVKSFVIPGSNIVKELVDVVGFQNCVDLKHRSLIEHFYGKDAPESMTTLDPEEFERLYNLALMNRKRDEEFVYKLSLNLSTIFIVVVSHLTMQQQTMIEEVKDEIKRSGSRKKQMFVIHNLKNVTENGDYDKCLQEVCENFDAEGIQISPDGKNMITYYQEKNTSGIGVRHFFLGREGTDAGEKNESVFKFFHLFQMTDSELPILSKPFFARLMEELNILVPKFVRNVKYDSNNFCLEYVKSENQETEEQPCGKIQFLVEDKEVLGAKKTKKKEDEEKIQRRRLKSNIVYRYMPNVTGFGSGSRNNNNSEFNTIQTDRHTDSVIKKMNEEGVEEEGEEDDEEKKIFRFEIEVPGISQEKQLKKKKTKSEFDGVDINKTFEENDFSTQFFWCLRKSLFRLYVKIARRRRFGRMKVSDWEQMFDIPLGVDLESLVVEVREGLVSFVFDVYDDE